LSKGRIHIYTGNGKGKTTASIGLAVRAAGAGLKVCIYQFVKAKPSCEFKALKKISKIKVEQCGRGLIRGGKSSVADFKCASSGLVRARRDIESGKYDLMILDEVNVATDMGLLDVKDVLELIDIRRPSLELVLTGRGADKRLIGRADYVTRFEKIKHPFDKGVLARRGIEY